MRLPFTHDQFLDVFAAYNRALWPADAALWLAAIAVLLLLARARLSPRLAGGLLAVLWAWAGIAYHFAFFARVNPAARAFGALFVLQAALFLWFGVRRSGLRIAWGRRPRQLLSIAFCAYAVLYPVLAFAAGFRWPRMPMFGLPCPTTLLTAGLLLGLEPGRLRALGVIPLLWCAIGGSAAVLLGVAPDWMLPVAGAALAVNAAVPRALAGPASA